MKASVVSVCLMLGLVGDAAAHHSNAAYDLDHLRTMEGTVRQINWTNPHVSFVIEGDAKKGAQVGTWVFEAASPGVLSRSGWTKRSLQVGDHAVFCFGPLRDGRPGGYLSKVMLPSGQELSYTSKPDEQ
jgi:Family of unknown function (DUF6152)